MQISRVEDLDALRRFHSLESAGHEHDFVALPADPFEELVPALGGERRAGERVRMFLGTDQGSDVGILTLTLFTLDNPTAGALELAVHPAHRRRGHGRALLQFGIEEARRHGRTRIFMQTPCAADGSPGPANGLMTDVGARVALDDYRRLLDLRQRPPGKPVAVPAGYRVVQWLDRAPDDVVDGLAYLMGRMSLDAPMGEKDYDAEQWDAARYRLDEESTVRRQRTRIATAVVHEASQAVAGVTDIGLNRSAPAVAYQWTTIVDPDHRGHGLGMVVKSWNHAQLVREVPEARFLNTWNAASNSFMIAVNDALGFVSAERWSEWQLDLLPAGVGS